jgi:hypothetical protein
MRPHPFAALLLCAALSLPAPAFAAPQAKGKPAPARVQIYLVDTSESMTSLRDATQAALTHQVKLAELAGDDVKVAVVFFGGHGVKVVGGKDGKPTAATKGLLDQLLRDWPRPSGATPMDGAFQEAVRLAAALPPGSDATVLLFTDGEPDSCVLRPEAFPEIKAQIDKALKAYEEQHKDLPPALLQNALARKKIAFETSGTEEWKQAYDRQRDLEFARVLEHAKTLRQARVRLVTVDYVGNYPRLKEIHQAAGGRAADLLVCRPPVAAIAKLHNLGLTALPGVAVQAPLHVAADQKASERTLSVRLDPVGDRALVTVVFEPGIENFEKGATLEAAAGGTVLAFTLDNDDAGRLLSRDSAGAVVAAHLLLDPLPQDGLVSLTLRVAEAQTVPACTAYVHLRLAADLAVDFRPQHRGADAAAPHLVAPTQPARWLAALRSKKTGKAFAVKAIEPVLRHAHTGAEVRLDVKADPHSQHVFVSEPAAVPRGVYDVQLHVSLGSGGRLTLKLPRHVESRDADEYLSLEITQQAGGQTEHASHARGHVDFGELGDEHDTATVAVLVRSHGFAGTLTLTPGCSGLADEKGNTASAWLSAAPDRLVLPPGRAVRLLLRLKLPERIEQQIDDGAFEGVLHLTTEDGEPIPLRRFTPLAGVSEGEEVSRVRFTLRRPRLLPRAPRCFRDALRPGPQGRLELPVAVSFGRPFRRRVTLEVAHDSRLARAITAQGPAVFRDAKGRLAPWVRLVAQSDSERTREAAPGEAVTFVFLFEMDDDPDAAAASGELELSAPGMAPVLLTVEVVPRRPLLGPAVRRTAWFVGVLLALNAGWAALRYLACRRWREGRAFVLTPERPLPGWLGALQVDRRGRVSLAALKDVRHGPAGARPEPRGAGRPLPVPVEELSRQPWCVEEAVPEGEEGWQVELCDYVPDPPEIHGEIVAAPHQGRERARQGRLAWRRLLLATLCLLLAWQLYAPPVLASAQWLYDLLF